MKNWTRIDKLETKIVLENLLAKQFSKVHFCSFLNSTAVTQQSEQSLQSFVNVFNHQSL